MKLFIAIVICLGIPFTFISTNVPDDEVKVWDFESNEIPAFEYYGESWDTVTVGSPKTSKEIYSWGYKLFLENDSSKYVHPNFGDITSNYGYRSGKLHKGMDIRVAEGEPIYAAFDGVVRVKGYHPDGFGNFLVIRHFNGLETVYAHLHVYPNVKQNQIIKGGEAVAYGGNTGKSSGNHLHFEFRFLGKPFDPNLLVNFENYQLKTSVVVIDDKWFDW